MIGESFSHYRVTGRLGSGGMGDVYRAEDTKLRRPVAIKVLPEAFARDEERMKRFEREAQVLASLNHPNVAAIYGLEDVGSVRALVLELVEGPTLAERIAAGPLSFEDARRIARQIALGLEAAHEKSIVHRDLKPANVKLTVDGDVKILDFGLAKAMEGEAASVDISHSPTMTRAATEAGFLLGTAAYMSPEQAKGKKVDRRTDIWAFGVVLFEMLTGRRLFAGETVSDILAAVLREEPPWQELPPRLSPALRWVLRRCLQKDPRERLHDIADARIELSEAHKDDALAPDRTRESPWPRRVLPWTVALAAAGVAAWIGLRSFSDRSSPETVAASILPPPNAEFLVERGFALSPDARQLVFAAEDGEGERALWLRSLASSAAQKLAGTEEGHSPFWSPDGRQVGFFANGKLKRIDLQSGLVENVTDHPTELGSGSWSSQGEIVFGGRGTEVELKRVLARGGVPEVVFPDGEAVERVLPSFLPDDGRFLFLARNYAGTSPQLRVGSLDGALEREVLRINSNAVYALSGHLVWWEDGNLREQRFDPGRLVVDGEPRVLAAEVEFDPSWGRGAFSLSGTTLVYHEGGLLLGSELVRFSRGGEELGTVGPPGNYYFPRLSPDGSRVAVDRSDEANRG
ncbi:MAG TPA: protein kinase, partial [Vicinamibacteria bacterium]|nr:protein kinase [Vicinamibacteria bacterium]